ncbi:PEP-CTERM putative exosortase interaction domain protein [Coleofasciculus chthonoplastes PCC 7420]|uniref:PEP-CTERM putative exosortase interaction domain protein n=1 Tax=Coleofasciculus chthonoplastes PCC 7420 TaxID=118168 RepID=B4VMZ2_9CYAN|nr:PEP-CTERM sorting domain-containing protein [Coleofasciculus chthonoplastes]EDX76671.1 PEP-CTERM putative exosortase interaction domain protein [Coleofasciculus chthonoplastes PCC 7420]
MTHSKVIGKLSLTTALATLIAVLSSPAAQAIVIDFEDNAIEPNNNEDVLSSITSQDFLFEPTLPGETQYALANNVFEAHNDSTYFVIRNLVDNDTLEPFINPVIMSQVNETPFSLLSLDLAEWGVPQDQATRVEVTGFLAGGGSITKLISFDGVTDGSGPLEDFQTVTFNQQWSNLSSVEFKGIDAPVSDDPSEEPGFQVNSFAVDNIEVGEAFEEPHTEVPEPASILGIFALGAVGFGSRLTKKITQR